jgi:large subunit ribosomal protein L1
VTADVVGAVKNAKAGQVRFRADKAGIVHCTIGKADFEVAKLKDNLQALLNDVNKAKPSTAKGVYLKKITIASTMGPGLVIDQNSLAL